MAEGRSNGGLVSVNSMELRWVYQDEEGCEIDDDGNPGCGEGDSTLHDSEDEDYTEKKLIRTGPRIDSFDVEALEVRGAQRNDHEEGGCKFKRFTLAVDAGGHDLLGLNSCFYRRRLTFLSANCEKHLWLPGESREQSGTIHTGYTCG